MDIGYIAPLVVAPAETPWTEHGWALTGWQTLAVLVAICTASALLSALG